MKRIKRLLLFILLCVFILGGLCFYAFHVEPKRLVVKEHIITKTNEDYQELRILQCSDLHIKENTSLEYLDKFVSNINELQPDIVIFTGDLFDDYDIFYQSDQDDITLDDIANRLSNIEAKIGKYAVYGNRDYGGGSYKEYGILMQESGFTLLKNQVVCLNINGKSFGIGGMDDALFGNPERIRVVEKLNHCDYKLLLMHEPDCSDDYKDDGIDLILAGHSHGGQIRLPFIDVVTTSLGEKYISGFYTINESTDSKVFVNTGIGTTKIDARFMVPPQIDVFHIKF